MNHVKQSVDVTPDKPRERVLSIDLFRGLTMLVMIFVNEAASVGGLPWWTYHMPGGVNGMTYVDVVFPSFLFIVGMSIPLAIERRLERGESQWRLWRHVLLRFASLALLGIFIANWSRLDPSLAGLSKTAWSLTGFAGALLVWNVYPRESKRQTVFTLLRGTGFVMFFGMLALYRRAGPDGQAAWLSFGYWEILGLIARAYLATCLLYVPLRKRTWGPAALLAAMVALNAATRLGWVPFLRHLPFWVWPFGNGGLVSVTLAGIVAAQILVSDRLTDVRRRLRWSAGYTLALAAAGWALIGFGISKNGGTPTWCLWSAAISMALIAGLYWLVDVRGHWRWAAFAKPAGSNTLLTYLVPDVFYAAFGVAWIGAPFDAGAPGLLRAVLFTAAMLAVAAGLTRWRVRLQL
jgi:predicted acyltransferase